MRWGRKCTGREIWENFAFLKLQPFFIWEDSPDKPGSCPTCFPAAAPHLTPGVCLQGPGEAMLTPCPAWRIPVLPTGALGGRKPPCLNPGCGYPETALGKHTKDFLGIGRVILSSSAVIVAFSLGVQVGRLSEVGRDGGYGEVNERERIFYK